MSKKKTTRFVAPITRELASQLHEFSREMHRRDYGSIDDDDDDDDNDLDLSESSSSDISCGIDQLYGLSRDQDVIDQLVSLIDALSVNSTGTYLTGRAQIIFSDIISEEDSTWAEAKAASYHGPVNRNPNSGNDIKLYIFTPECFPDLIKKLPQKIKRKYFPTNKNKK